MDSQDWGEGWGGRKYDLFICLYNSGQTYRGAAHNCELNVMFQEIGWQPRCGAESFYPPIKTPRQKHSTTCSDFELCKKVLF